MDTNWNLTGHEWAVDLLRRHVAGGEARHAYLFCGPEGVGRRTLAARFAQALNCPNPPAPGEFCGDDKCYNCRQIAALSHADLALVPPFIKDGSLGVDQVREAQRILSRTPMLGRYRVSVFPGFDAATEEAQNALLKTLEEPPAHAVLILTAENPEQLLPTIVSRCEVVRLKPVPVERVEQMLLDGNVEPSKARLLAHVSEGRPALAKRLLTDEELMSHRLNRLEELKAMLKSSRVERFALAEKLAGTKCDHKHVEENETIKLSEKEKRQLASVVSRCVLRKTYPIWLSFWRDVMLKASGAAVPVTNIDCEEQIEALATRLDLPAACRLVSEMELGIRRLNDNVNTRLLTEVLLLDWPRI